MCHLSNELACLPGRNCSVKIYIHIILFELPFPNLFKNGEVFKSLWTGSLTAPFPAPSKVIICQEPRAVPWLVILLISRNKPVPRGTQVHPHPSLPSSSSPWGAQQSILCLTSGGPCTPPLDARGAKVLLPTQWTRDRRTPETYPLPRGCSLPRGYQADEYTVESTTSAGTKRLTKCVT